MAKQIVLIVAGMATLVSGFALAETPASPCLDDDPGYINGGHFSGRTGKNCEAEDTAKQKEAAAPEAARIKAGANLKTNPGQDLHPDARPVYLDGGHWGR